MENRSNLVEIKKNQTGYGLLIENDGFISMKDGDNRKLYESLQTNENGWHCPNPFIVSAVFQKFGIENANGRIYPEAELKREVEKYQTNIRESRAYGECYRPEALILTEDGWKHLYEIKEGENILTLNPETKNIEVKPILRIIKKNAKKLVHIQGRSIDDYVTREHEYPIYNRNHKFAGFYTAGDILTNCIPDKNHSYIPKIGNWVGRNDENFVIPKLSNEEISSIRSKQLKAKYAEDIVIPMDIFAKFMGIYLSEGSCDKNGKRFRVNIHQKKDNVCDEIQLMLDAFPLAYTINERENGCKTFVICDMRLNKYMRQFGLAHEKYVPFELKQQNSEILRQFYDWFVMGDGRVRGDKRRHNKSFSDDVFTTSERLCRDLNEIQLKIGYSGTFHVDEHNYDRKIEENRIIKAENSKPLYFTYRSLTKGVYLDERFLKVTEEDYDGEVMCIEVENHIWYVSDGGFCHWTKNCNHPSESTIDLSRICMNIVELHWEGHTLVGKMEILTSEGFRKQGIISCQGDMIANHLLNGLKIGVSSRGVGDVENKFGVMYVSNYQLICWDVVSDPSTKSAYIVTGGEEELKQYVENDETKKKENPLFEQLKSFDGWLTE